MVLKIRPLQDFGCYHQDEVRAARHLTENQIKHLKESFGTAPLDAIRQPLEAAQKGLAEASEDIEEAKSRLP
jgi:hypothetical protein